MGLLLILGTKARTRENKLAEEKKLVKSKKRGPKPKYRSSMCDVIISVAEQGGHVAAMCQAIGVRSQDTFFRWVRENEEFRKAYDTSRLKSKAFYEELLLAGACGKIKGFNFNSLAMILNNKFPEDYKRSATGSNTEINIGSINSIEMDPKQLDEKIAAVSERLKALNVDVPEYIEHDDE